jgi:uncharacterized protein (UPF0548 family)
MWSILRPSDEAAKSLLDAQSAAKFSYPEVGASRGVFPAGYQHDRNCTQLGVGETVYQRARTALQQWRMFPTGWTQVLPSGAPIREGQMVAVLAQTMGTWWLNTCRIVYVIDEVNPLPRFGFAYGTVEHVECGEERFIVEQLADDTVWYDLRAFSRPEHWLARLGSPLARRLQKRFARESLAAMRAAVAGC